MMRSGRILALQKQPLCHKPVVGFFSFELEFASMVSGVLAEKKEKDLDHSAFPQAHQIQ